MTDIVFYKLDNVIYSVECSGHTGYDVEGRDIVCSALSSLIQGCALGLKEVVMVKPKIKINENNGFYKIDLPRNITEDKLRDSQILLQTLFVSVKDLAQVYSEYINLEERDYVY